MCEILRVRHLGYSYSASSFKALNDVNFSISKGEIVGIIGPNGSGKTTMVKSISSILQYEGSVKIEDKEVKDYSRKKLARILGVVAQEFLPSYNMSTTEVVELGRIPYTTIWGQITNEDKRAVEMAFESLEISHLKDRMFYSLSGGERQMVYVAKVFAQEPKILVLDEATAHLDIGHTEHLLKKIMKLSRENGKTVIATFHDINQAAAFSDRIMVMKDGNIVADGTPEDVLKEEIIYKVYGAHCTIIHHPRTGRIRVLSDLEDERNFAQQRSTLIRFGNSRST